MKCVIPPLAVADPAIVPGRWQFSLRGMFIVVTLAAITLAIAPKDERAMFRLLYVPQLFLAGWALYRKYRPALRSAWPETRSSRVWFFIALISGLVMPALVLLAAALAVAQTYLNFSFLIVCFLSPVIIGPLTLILMFENVIRDSRLPLAFLHLYNMAAVVVTCFYIDLNFA